MRTSVRPPFRRPSPRAGATPGRARRRAPALPVALLLALVLAPALAAVPAPAPARAQAPAAPAPACVLRWVPNPATLTALSPNPTAVGTPSRADYQSLAIGPEIPDAGQGAPFAQAKREIYGPAPLLCAQAGLSSGDLVRDPDQPAAIMVVAGPVPGGAGLRPPVCAQRADAQRDHRVALCPDRRRRRGGAPGPDGRAGHPELGPGRRFCPGHAGDLRPGRRPVPAGRTRHRRPDPGGRPGGGLRGDRPVPAAAGGVLLPVGAQPADAQRDLCLAGRERRRPGPGHCHQQPAR